MEDALAADPTAFEYDGVYRDMKKEEIARKMADKETGPKKVRVADPFLLVNDFLSSLIFIFSPF